MYTKTKRNKAAALSFLLGIIYLLYSFAYFYHDILGSYASITMGSSIARALILPHLFSALTGVCLSFLGFSLTRSRYTLSGGFFYAAAMVFYPPFSRYLIAPLLLALLAYAHMPGELATQDWD